MFVSQKSEVDAADAVNVVGLNPHITGSRNRRHKNKMFRVKGCKILSV